MRLDLDGGGAISLERFDGERGEGTSDAALPPGSRPRGTIVEHRVRLKVEWCRAAEPGIWSVRVRFIDLQRDLRARIREGIAQRSGR